MTKDTFTTEYPTSPRVDHADVVHGITVADPYRWLEEIDSEQTQRWIKAQNETSSSYLAKIPQREAITKRLTELWDYERYGVPFLRGPRVFFTRNNGLENQSVLYWSESLRGAPKVLLDPNQLAADGTVALIDYAVSKDGRYLAYGLS